MFITFPRFFLIVAILAGTVTSSFAQAIKIVAITSIVEHPSLDNIRRGVTDELTAQGFSLGKDLSVQYKSAQGSSATAAQIAKQFVAIKADVIVPITTPSAQAVAASTKNIPIVFSGITDPVAAKLIKDWQPSGTNITGISDELPLAPQIDLMLKIKPDLKTVGYVYSPGEINSTIVLKKLKSALAEKNIQVLAVSAQKTSDVAPAARSLKGKVDLIYTTTDNNVVSAYEALVKVAIESKIPLIASDPDSVDRGAVASLGMSYYDMGRQTGKIVTRVLNGEKVGEITPEKGTTVYLVINPESAKRQGLIFSDDFIKGAHKVVGR